MAFAGSALTYDAQVASSNLTGQARLSVSKDGVAVTGLFSSAFIAWRDLVSGWFADYRVTINTVDDCFTFSGLGNLAEAFYLEAYDSFNARVRQALFIDKSPVCLAEGDFRYAEPEATAEGRARFEVYPDCLVILPFDDRARRIPYAFMTGMQTGNYQLSVTLDGGEQYSFMRLGSNTDPFAAAITAALHHYRENALAAVRALDPSLNAAQLSAIAGLMPEGVAAPVGKLSDIGPSYVAQLEAMIGYTRAGETYPYLSELCSPGSVSVGMKTNLAGEKAENVLWFVAPSSYQPAAAVELALDEDTPAATFVYAVKEDPETFARLLNRAMEAVVFHREIISMPEAQLAAHDVYRMAEKRTASVRFLRDRLIGRVIHSSDQAWKTQIDKLMGETK